YSDFGSGEDHCSSQPLCPRMASRAIANTEYFRMPWRLAWDPSAASPRLDRGVALAKSACHPCAVCDGDWQIATRTRASQHGTLDQPNLRPASTARPRPTLPKTSPLTTRAPGNRLVMAARTAGMPVEPPVMNSVSTRSAPSPA